MSAFAYLFKYPYIAMPYSTTPADEDLPFCSYNLDATPTPQKFVYSGVDFIKSRNNLRWQEGLDYTIGLGIRPFVNGSQAGSDQTLNNGANGNWVTPFNSYQLNATGVWANIDGIGGSTWNGSYAFAQLQDFDFRVNTNSFQNAKDAGILIRQSNVQSLSNSPFIYLFYDVEVNYAYIGYRTTTGFQGYLSFAGANTYLRATKQNNIIHLYTSTDGITYTLRIEQTFLTGTVFAGMAMSPKYATIQGNVLFTGVSIKNQVPVSPFNLSLSKIGTAANLGFSVNEGLNKVTISGNSTLGSTSDNVVFANVTLKAAFIANVKIEAASVGGGIMIRQNTNANSPMVYLRQNAGKASIYYRTTAGATAVWTPSTFPALPLPGYLRLIRIGTTIRAMMSTDGISFSQIADIPFVSGPLLVGLCAEGGSNVSATLTGFSVRNSDVTPMIKPLLIK